MYHQKQKNKKITNHHRNPASELAWQKWPKMAQSKGQLISE
jgi:hypothetical protein